MDKLSQRGAILTPLVDSKLEEKGGERNLVEISLYAIP